MFDLVVGPPIATMSEICINRPKLIFTGGGISGRQKYHLLAPIRSGRLASHIILDILALQHLSCKSCSNIFNGATTKVVPDFWLRADHWNNKLLGAPQPMTINTGPTLLLVTFNACSYLPRNAAFPTMLCNSNWIFKVFNRFHRATWASYTSSPIRGHLILV